MHFPSLYLKEIIMTGSSHIPSWSQSRSKGPNARVLAHSPFPLPKLKQVAAELWPFKNSSSPLSNASLDPMLPFFSQFVKSEWHSVTL